MMQMLYVNTALSLCLSPMLPQMIICALSHWFHFCPPSQISIFSSPRENRRLVLHFGVGSLQAAEVGIAVKWIISPDSVCLSCLRFPFPSCLWVKLLQFCVDGASGVIVLMSWLLCSHSDLILGSWRWPSWEVVEVREAHSSQNSSSVTRVQLSRSSLIVGWYNPQ